MTAKHSVLPVQPRSHLIGVGVFVRRGEEILIGKRGHACRRGAGCWALPGGVVECGESILTCAIREVFDETGVTVGPGAGPAFSVPGVLGVTDHNDLTSQLDGNLIEHLTLWILADYVSGEAQIREPEKCDGWHWAPPHLILRLPGASNPQHPQYYWTPRPLWEQILRPYFAL